MPAYHIDHNLIIDGTLYALLVFSVLTWTVILFKIWQFSRNSFYNRRFNEAFWDASDLAAVKVLPETVVRGPQSRVAKKGLAWLAGRQHATGKHLKYKGGATEVLEQALLEAMQVEARRLEFGLTMLASIGSTAPFVGLFGTVLGIMHAMHEITASGSTSLNVVAGPIGDALVATAIGIAVAVPAVLAYNFMLRNVKQHRAGLENFVVAFVHIASESDASDKA
ncbi:MAG: MotA/TolQ/ExbB proton channel family protein [Methylococcales bacterium]|nr:MotA/TolQ/ExbB proton channel family protein [Methylococcales bacterium]